MTHDGERAGGETARESYLSASDLEVAFTRLPPGSERPEPPTCVMPPNVLEGAMRGAARSEGGDTYDDEVESATVPRRKAYRLDLATEIDFPESMIPITQGTMPLPPSTLGEAFMIAAALRARKTTEKMSSSAPPSAGPSAGAAAAIPPLAPPPAIAADGVIAAGARTGSVRPAGSERPGSVRPAGSERPGSVRPAGSVRPERAPPPKRGRALVGMALAVAVGGSAAVVLFHLFA